MTAATRSTGAATIPAEGADGGPRIYGVIDVIRPDRIAGWAIDRGDSRAAVEIEVLREGRPVATVRADRPRKDLERGGVGTGRYGFACELAPPLEPGFEFTVAVRARTADGVRIDLRRGAATTEPTNPDRRLLERLFEELCAQRAAPAPIEAEPAAALPEMIAQLELAQLRIEASLGTIPSPAPARQTGLKLLVAAALATGLGSLALGLVSMWWP